MKQSKSLYWLLFTLLTIMFEACDPSPKVNNETGQQDQSQIALIVEDSLVWNFLKQRKVSLKYLNDDSMPEIIDFSAIDIVKVFSIKSERESVELLFTDNSQSRYSYFLSKGDSVQIGLDKQKPWLKTVNRNTTVYDDNLELLRNRDLHQSTYSKLQDFYFLLQTNFGSPTPIDLREELQQAKLQAMESLDAELAWLDSLRNGEFISEQTGDFYSAKAKFERSKLEFFDKDNGEFNETSALQHYLTDIDESLKQLQTIYLDEFSDFLLEQITPDDPYKILHPEILGPNPSPFGKRLLFKILQRSLPYLPFKKADEWLTTYEHQLENTEQAKFLKDRIDKLREERPDMDLMGIGDRRISFEELLDQKRGKYLYVDLWAAWCIPCIKAFPALRELNEAYKDQGVEVIHLSVDHNHKFWEEVVRKYEIADPERSFIALNLAESTFLQKLDVDFIPRYLIFDPHGKLIHPHAAGPESEEIVRFFGELLSEKAF